MRPDSVNHEFAIHCEISEDRRSHEVARATLRLASCNNLDTDVDRIQIILDCETTLDEDDCTIDGGRSRIAMSRIRLVGSRSRSRGNINITN